MSHSERKHALLSASGAERWLSCTPSARLEEKYEATTPSKASIYADEGTLAHEISELKLRFQLGQTDEKTYKKELEKLQKHELWAPEMEEFTDGYVAYVLGRFEEAKEVDPFAEIRLESRLDFSHLVENGFGTGDVIIYYDATVVCIDLKYGKGVRVDAEDNPQLKLYASGAVRMYEVLEDVVNVVAIIVQPRLDHISSTRLTVKELEEWGEQVVKPTAQIAYLGEGEQVAGDHCKFCKVKGICRAFADKNLELAKYEFRDPFLLSKDELLNVYKYTPMLQDWAKSVEDHITAQALKGEVYKGYKLVEGKSNRRWTDEEVVKNNLFDGGFMYTDFTNVKLKSITDIQTLVGKEFFNERLSTLVTKPEGAPTLVLESDKRIEYKVSQIDKDFGQAVEGHSE